MSIQSSKKKTNLLYISCIELKKPQEPKGTKDIKA